MPAGSTSLDGLQTAEDGLLTVVVKAAQRGSWPAAMPLLGIIRPDVYGNRPVAPPVPTGVATERERRAIFDEIDELAARRARR